MSNFSSISFLWFLAVFLTLYGLCPARYRRYLLLLSGLVFVWFSSWLDMGCIFGLTLANYLMGICIRRTAFRKEATAAAVACNLILLIAFKLTGALPLGISYYSFAFISYLVDISRRSMEPEYDPIRFANFSFFFPKLLMGPITRYGELGVHMDNPKPRLSCLQEGLESFVLGFIIKIFVVDRLAIFWNDLITTGISCLHVSLAWAGAISFSMQLFLEWQSYSLMAMGIAGCLGYQLPQNFNYPYLSRSIGEFYRRWHITLGRWFKDYVYIPLGGSRQGTRRTVFNLLIVWFLTAIWHGPALGWNFLLWGMSLGVFIVIEKLWLGPVLAEHRLLSHLWVLFLIPLTWVCFKFNNTAELAAYFARLFPFFGGESIVGIDIVWLKLKKFGIYLILGVLCCFPLPEQFVHRYGKTRIGSILLAVLFWWAVYELNRFGSNPMMYLDF